MSSDWRQSVLRVLAQYAPAIDPSSWSVKTFARGNQARLFQAQCFDTSQNTEDMKLLVKIFMSQAGMREAVKNEFNGLTFLNQSVHAPGIDGWRFQASKPLYLCHDPVAIVLTQVDGFMLEKQFYQLRSGPEQWIDSLAHAACAKLIQYWNVAGSQYGDLNLFNLLCNPEKRIFSLVDPGIPSDIFTCPDVSRGFLPASRDLGYLLYEISTENCQPSIAYFRIARRRNQFVRTLFQNYIDSELAPDQTDPFIKEVADCINTHLGRIETNSILFGSWRSHVRRTATKNARRILTTCLVNCGESDSTRFEASLSIGTK